MKNSILTVIIVFLSYSTLFCQEKQLTTQQKVNDFLYAYDVFKDNYPFFGVCKRVHGVDWLNKKDEYTNRVIDSKDDVSYIATLKGIFDELKDGHVSFNATRYGHQGYHSAYKKIAMGNPRYNKWVELFENPKARINYWSDILDRLDNSSVKNTKNNATSQLPKSNYSDTIIDKHGIAVMKILSFNMHNIDKDKQAIDHFFNKIHACNYLIIDIQDNSGGAVRYWKENIVERLVTDTVINTSYPIIKNGAVNRHFYPEFFARAKKIEKSNALPNIPDELLDEAFYINSSNDSIAPNSPIDFHGKIFILVSKTVFSSSEGFAQFCKNTGWATIAGERTGGDGIGSDPAIIILPESGILVSYPSLVGLNNDGSINAEEKTIPDMIINGSTSEERLDKLIRRLTQGVE